MKTAAVLMLLALSEGSQARVEGTALQEAEAPKGFEARGKLVCLIEEMKEKYKSEANPIHDHILGFRIEGAVPAGGVRYYTILRNKYSEALFEDARFKAHELRLIGRVFPASSVIEISRFQWYREGKLFDVSYWCSVCAIRGVDPGPCHCCQGKVELQEDAVAEPKK